MSQITNDHPTYQTPQPQQQQHQQQQQNFPYTTTPVAQQQQTESHLFGYPSHNSNGSINVPLNSTSNLNNSFGFDSFNSINNPLFQSGGNNALFGSQNLFSMGSNSNLNLNLGSPQNFTSTDFINFLPTQPQTSITNNNNNQNIDAEDQLNINNMTAGNTLEDNNITEMVYDETNKNNQISPEFMINNININQNNNITDKNNNTNNSSDNNSSKPCNQNNNQQKSSNKNRHDIEINLNTISNIKNNSSKKSKKQNSKQGWTTEEHINFLKGISIYGKGAWKDIAQVVGTRTPTQIQSHAQKYYLRQKQEVKNKKSIHDLSLSELISLSGQNSSSEDPSLSKQIRKKKKKIIDESEDIDDTNKSSNTNNSSSGSGNDYNNLNNNELFTPFYRPSYIVHNDSNPSQPPFFHVKNDGDGDGETQYQQASPLQQHPLLPQHPLLVQPTTPQTNQPQQHLNVIQNLQQSYQSTILQQQQQQPPPQPLPQQQPKQQPILYQLPNQQTNFIPNYGYQSYNNYPLNQI